MNRSALRRFLVSRAFGCALVLLSQVGWSSESDPVIEVRVLDGGRQSQVRVSPLVAPEPSQQREWRWRIVDAQGQVRDPRNTDYGVFAVEGQAYGRFEEDTGIDGIPRPYLATTTDVALLQFRSLGVYAVQVDVVDIGASGPVPVVVGSGVALGIPIPVECAAVATAATATPSSLTLSPGSSASLSLFCQDQFGAPLRPTWSWSGTVATGTLATVQGQDILTVRGSSGAQQSANGTASNDLTLWADKTVAIVVPVTVNAAPQVSSAGIAADPEPRLGRQVLLQVEVQDLDALSFTWSVTPSGGTSTLLPHQVLQGTPGSSRILGTEPSATSEVTVTATDGYTTLRPHRTLTRHRLLGLRPNDRRWAEARAVDWQGGTTGTPASGTWSWQVLRWDTPSGLYVPATDVGEPQVVVESASGHLARIQVPGLIWRRSASGEHGWYAGPTAVAAPKVRDSYAVRASLTAGGIASTDDVEVTLNPPPRVSWPSGGTTPITYIETGELTAVVQTTLWDLDGLHPTHPATWSVPAVDPGTPLLPATAVQVTPLRPQPSSGSSSGTPVAVEVRTQQLGIARIRLVASDKHDAQQIVEQDVRIAGPLVDAQTGTTAVVRALAIAGTHCTWQVSGPGQPTIAGQASETVAGGWEHARAQVTFSQVGHHRVVCTWRADGTEAVVLERGVSVVVTPQPHLAGSAPPAVEPAAAWLAPGGQQTFRATGVVDQFGAAVAPQWSLVPSTEAARTATGWLIAADGTVVAGTLSGSAQGVWEIQAVWPGLGVSATGTVATPEGQPNQPPSWTSDIFLTTTTVTPDSFGLLQVNARAVAWDDQGPGQVQYTWTADGPVEVLHPGTLQPTVSELDEAGTSTTWVYNGSVAAHDVVIRFPQAGTYMLQVTASDGAGAQCTTSTTVRAVTTLRIAPGSAWLQPRVVGQTVTAQQQQVLSAWWDTDPPRAPLSAQWSLVTPIPSGTPPLLSPVVAPTTTLTNGSGVGSYQVRVQVGTWTAQATIVSQTDPVPAPSGVTASVEGAAIRIAWDGSALVASPIPLRVIIERRAPTGVATRAVLPSDAASWVDTTAAVDVRYDYVVWAETEQGRSSASSTVSGMRAALPFTVQVTTDPPSPQVGSPVTVQATVQWPDSPGLIDILLDGHRVSRTTAAATGTVTWTPNAPARISVRALAPDGRVMTATGPMITGDTGGGGDGGGGGGGTDTIQPPTVTITALGIAPGSLSGDQTVLLNQESWSVTKQASIQMMIDVRTSGSSTSTIAITGGRITIGGATREVTPAEVLSGMITVTDVPEGLWEVGATVTATASTTAPDGSIVSVSASSTATTGDGTSSDPVRLIVWRQAPRVQVSYGFAGPPVSPVSEHGWVLPSVAQDLPVLLNGNTEDDEHLGNRRLRQERHTPFFGAADFTALLQCDAPAGLSRMAGNQRVEVQGSSVGPVELDLDPASGLATGLRVRGWASLAGQTSAQPVTLTLCDACGNSATVMADWRVLVDTQEPQIQRTAGRLDLAVHDRELDRVFQFGALGWLHSDASAASAVDGDLVLETYTDEDAVFRSSRESYYDNNGVRGEQDIQRRLGLLSRPLPQRPLSGTIIDYIEPAGTMAWEMGRAWPYDLQDIAGNHSERRTQQQDRHYAVAWVPWAASVEHRWKETRTRTVNGSQRSYAVSRWDDYKYLHPQAWVGDMTTYIGRLAQETWDRYGDHAMTQVQSRSQSCLPGLQVAEFTTEVTETVVDNSTSNWRRTVEGLSLSRVGSASEMSEREQEAKDAEEEPPQFLYSHTRGVAVDGKQQFRPAIINLPTSWEHGPTAGSKPLPAQIEIHDRTLAGMSWLYPQPLDGSAISARLMRGPSQAEVDQATIDQTRSFDAVRWDPARAVISAELDRTDFTVARPGAWTVAYDFPRPLDGATSAPPYSNRGLRWFNAIRASPDIVAAGSRMTIAIDANFLGASLSSWKDFQAATGDYVHIILGGTDVTIPIGQGQDLDAQARAGKVAIVGQRLIPWYLHPTISQRLELDLEIGRDVTPGLAHIDVRLGDVHAYPDELSKQYEGANGSHRMKEALAVVKLAVKDVEVGQMESKKIEDFITFEAPHLSENEIETLMKGWTIEWPSGGNAYLLENDPSAFKKLTSIKPLMITESKGVQDVYVLGGNVIHDELDAEPQPYTGQFYIRTDNLTATMGISGVLGNITVTPAVAQIQTVYDAQKTFIAAPKGLPSLLGRPGIVSFRDAQWDFDLKPGNPGTDGTGRNTKFVVRFDGSVQSDLNKPCVRITKWDDGKSFHVTGDYPGTGILQVRPLFGEEEGDVICEIPIPVEIPVISEPSMLQLDTAKARAETRRNSNDENLIEDPTPLAADENDNPLLEMPKSASTAYPFGQVVAPTASVQRLDGIYEHAMFVAGQILPITADGWTEPFDVEKNSDAAFTFPSASNDYELSLALLCSLLTDGSSTSPAPVQSKLALSPVADIWRRYQKRIKQQTDKDLEPRGAQDVLAQEKRAIELRGKTLVQLASAARLKRFFSLSVDGEDKPTVQGLANWSYPSGPLGQHLPMMGESGGNIIYISDVDDLKSALGNWMGSVGLPKLFQNSPAAIDWKYGHPLTEDLITHMVGERMDFTKTAMEIVGADWSAHLTPIWYDDVVPNELMNAKVHYFMDADGWVKLRMIGASGQSLNWTLCPSQEGYPQGYYTYQGTTYRLLRVRADSPIGLGVGLAQDEIYRLLMAYNHRAYADYWTSFGNNSPTGLFAFVIGDTLFGITDIFQTYTGTDLVTGENLSNGQRAYSAAMVLLMVVPADTLVLKGVTKLLRSGKSALSATSKAIYENVSKSAAGSEAARGAKAMADAAEDQIATQGAKQTPTGTPSAGDGLGSAARRPGGFVAMGWQGVRQVFRGTYSISDLYNLHAGCAALTNHVVVAKGATSPLVGMFRSLTVAGKQVLASPLSLKYLPRNARELIDNFASQQQFIDEMIEVYGREEGMKKLEYLRKIACFTGDTTVLIADGSRKPISQIAVGDWVATRSQFDASAPMTAGRVTEVFRHDTTELRVIRAVRQTNNGLLSVVIRTTDEHPFWKISSGWVVAAALNSGDKVASTDGCLTIMTVDREYTQRLSVYNLQIDGGSTYFVGGNEFGGDVWVHNVCRQQDIMLKYLRAHPDLLGGRPVAAVANDALVKLSKGESMGIPGIVIPGDSRKLGVSLGAKPFTDAAAHHLLSSEVVKRSGPVGDFFRRVGFDCNRRGNGMWLPMKKGVLGATPLTIHDGNHPGYRNALEEVIGDIIAASSTPGRGDKWAIRKVRELQLLIRKELRGGTPLDLAGDSLGAKVEAIWKAKFLALPL